MLETLATVIGRSGWRYLSSLLDRYRRPEIVTKRAPKNIFEYLKPHTSLAKARELLGIPTRENSEYLSYKFRDAFIQVGSKDGKSIDSICVVLPKIHRRATFQVYPLEFILGQSSMADASWGDEPEYEYDSSSKHWQFWMKQYFGYEGYYLHYVFGVIDAPHISAPKFEWKSGEDEVNPTIISAPSKIIPNMVCISSSAPEDFSFDFWAFH